MHTSEHVDIPEYLYKREHKFTLDLHLYKNLIGELSRLISHGQSKTRKKSKEKLKVIYQAGDVVFHHQMKHREES